jgi:hypothetical protein
MMIGAKVCVEHKFTNSRLQGMATWNGLLQTIYAQTHQPHLKLFSCTRKAQLILLFHLTCACPHSYAGFFLLVCKEQSLPLREYKSAFFNKFCSYNHGLCFAAVVLKTLSCKTLLVCGWFVSGRGQPFELELSTACAHGWFVCLVSLAVESCGVNLKLCNFVTIVMKFGHRP